jgi:hypothetical protein
VEAPLHRHSGDQHDEAEVEHPSPPKRVPVAEARPVLATEALGSQELPEVDSGARVQGDAVPLSLSTPEAQRAGRAVPEAGERGQQQQADCHQEGR